MTTEHLHRQLSASRHAAVIDAAEKGAARLRAEAMADFGAALWPALCMALGRWLKSGRAALQSTRSPRRTATPAGPLPHRTR